ncbi:small nuclear RNA activating complex, subunit SNAP43-domain-containing protein [Glomus cerebriforme]|uniref:Small nuclear RNA activating complex, subunit SNAP43-domain-containing protein n=1 Tax=Glomus cerebriforme TaxID=658196 RepID=A0A397T1P5_9GLOM|nr:small nuclear RNA activating complex, subunit SNAP43-domain-containing protein [Glomus cerebriforme]
MNTQAPIAKNDQIILGMEVISQSALEQDVKMLMISYQKKQAYDFTSFTDVWKERTFSLIHFACPEKLGRSLFMQTLYQIILSYNAMNTRLLEVKLGVLYSLYLLYFTQPEVFPKERIRLTFETWQQIFELYKYSKQYDLYDAVYIYEKMRKERVFDFVYDVDPCGTILKKGTKRKATNSLKEIMQEISISPVGGLESTNILEDGDNIVQRYYSKRNKLMGTELAKIASNKVIRRRIDSHPIGQPIDPFTLLEPLNATDEYFNDNLKVRLDNMKSERLEYLTRAKTLVEENSKNIESQQTAFDVRNELRLQSYQKSNRQFVPFSLRATLKAAERDEKISRTFSMKAPPPPAKVLSSLKRSSS